MRWFRGRTVLTVMVVTFWTAVVAQDENNGDAVATDSAIKSLCDLNVKNYRLLTPTDDDEGVNNNENGTADNGLYCDCDTNADAPWGLPKISIDCSEMEINNARFLAKHLPFGTEVLALSWNALNAIPRFASNLHKLKILKMDNNLIERVLQDDLSNLTHLVELDLSYNQITTIEAGAFNDLNMLKRLRLDNNNITSLPDAIFSKMANIFLLNMNGNDLNNLLLQKNLFYDLRLNESSLQILELESCNLTWLNVVAGTELTEVRLRNNRFNNDLPELPSSVQMLDLSLNIFRKIDCHFYDGKLKWLEVLLLEDMPYLSTIDISSLSTLQSLKKLSFQGSRNLTRFHDLAFDPIESEHQPEESTFSKLTQILFTGTNLKKLDEEILTYAPNLEIIDLSGCPMICDCDLKWLMGTTNVKTNGVCEKPLSMYDQVIDELNPDVVTNCSYFSKTLFKAMNGILILFLLLLAGVAIYFLVMGCRPSKQYYIHQRFGANSPYSRITVEPNRLPQQ